MDSKEARVCRIENDVFELAGVSARHAYVQRAGGGDTAVHWQQRRFFDEVAGLLKGCEELLLVGPSNAKLDFVRYLQQHAPILETKITSVAAMDQPTDSELVAHARHYFRHAMA